MKKTLILFLLAALLLTACAEASDPEIPPGNALSGISLTLPEGMERKSVSQTQDHFLQDGQVIGGMAVMGVDSETMWSLRLSFEHTEVILDYIKENIIPGFDPERYDGYYVGGSVYGYFDAEIITLDGYTKHYLLQGENDYYDIWFDAAYSDSRVYAGIIESIQSEDLIVEGHMEFAEEAG